MANNRALLNAKITVVEKTMHHSSMSFIPRLGFEDFEDFIEPSRLL